MEEGRGNSLAAGEAAKVAEWGGAAWNLLTARAVGNSKLANCHCGTSRDLPPKAGITRHSKRAANLPGTKYRGIRLARG